MVETETIAPRWTGTCIVAATGPSLTTEVAEACRGRHIIAVNDAYIKMPFADVLYACDTRWYDVHNGCPTFNGEKWSSHDTRGNNKLAAAAKHGLRLVAGARADGFSLDPTRIHYGGNSGFQAIGLAILFGATRLVLVGFDMREVDGRRHFFGDHHRPLGNGRKYADFIPQFALAAQRLPPKTEILNATPDSALDCFPRVRLEDVLA